jgi:integrase
VGVYTRPDSPWYWLWLETSHTKEKTRVKIGRTTAQRHDSRRLADDVYHQRMNEIAARVHRLPLSLPAIRFSAYAEIYVRDVIVHQRGAERAGELVKALKKGFGDELLSTIDRARVQQYMSVRRAAVSANTVNREIDALKAMLRDAVPKYLDASPIVGMKRLPTVKPKRRLMTFTEERKILAVATNPLVRALIIIGVDSLVRMNDILDLKREDRRGRWIYLADPKSGDPVEVALSLRGAKALDQIPNIGPYYFQGFRGPKVAARDRRSRVRRLLERLCKRAGVPYGRKKGGITFHWATRRTGATRMLINKRIPVPVVQRQGTWKNPDVMLQIYAEADRKSLLAAVAPVRSQPKRKPA